MKQALNDKGDLIEANAHAPLKARCPRCNGIVTLRARHRDSLSKEGTYFWRHEDHTHPRCSARVRHYLAN